MTTSYVVSASRIFTPSASATWAFAGSASTTPVWSVTTGPEDGDRPSRCRAALPSSESARWNPNGMLLRVSPWYRWRGAVPA